MTQKMTVKKQTSKRKIRAVPKGAFVFQCEVCQKGVPCIFTFYDDCDPDEVYPPQDCPYTDSGPAKWKVPAWSKARLTA